jgi:hypothetical protein
MKNLLFIFFCCFASLSYCQVSSVDYLMKYNCETNQYDVSIIILEGSASSIPHRVQLNSQISIVAPTGESIVIMNKYMPLQSNQQYTGSAPLDWILSNPIFAPAEQPENDFYSVFPKLSPASFYNDIEEGDVIMLFSFTAGTTGQYDEGVRFYKNGIDPGDADPGMAGGDFSNGFTIGSPVNIYNGNNEESCFATDVDEAILEEINVYPNPFQNQLEVELPFDVANINVLGSDGKVYYQSGYKSKGVLRINAYDFPKGVYYIAMETENGITMKKVVKF